MKRSWGELGKLGKLGEQCRDVPWHVWELGEKKPIQNSE